MDFITTMLAFIPSPNGREAWVRWTFICLSEKKDGTEKEGERQVEEPMIPKLETLPWRKQLAWDMNAQRSKKQSCNKQWTGDLHFLG